MQKQRIVLSSTHLDSQGYVMTKSALESMLPFLNGKRKPRLGLEHIRTFPPYGVIMNGQIVQGDDEQYYLTADKYYFDHQEVLTLNDGSELIKESFKDGTFPFVECEFNDNEKLLLMTDPTNYESRASLEEMVEIIKQESGLEFDKVLIGRKSELPDPETIIKITNTIVFALGLVLSKIPQKLGDAIGEDLVKFYKFISATAYETIKRTNPSNRPRNFVIEYPTTEFLVELVISTRKPDAVLEALQKEKLLSISAKLEILKKLRPEKVQFIYSKEKVWEFNYLLNVDGEVIGTEKSFKRRNDMYNHILKNQNKK